MSQPLGGKPVVWSADNASLVTTPPPKSITEQITGVPSMSGGGEIDGPEGDDQIAAEFSDGRPARLEDGEVVLPKEFIHQLGVKAIRDAVEKVTGKKMDPTVKEPLPGQGRQGVLAAADGMVAARTPAQQAEYDKYLATVDAKRTDADRQSMLEADRMVASGKTKPAPDAKVIPEPKAPGSGYNPTAVDRFISRNTPRMQQGLEEGLNDFRSAETPATKIHHAAAGIGKTLVGGAADVVVPVAQAVADTAYELGTGEKATPWEKPTKPTVNTPKASVAESATPQMSPIPPHPSQQTEQQMLDRLAPDGTKISRNGQIFQMKDETEKRPGWSGVTFSDSIEGLKLGQKTPPATDAKTMEELRNLYKGMGTKQGAEQTARGLPAYLAELSAPTVTEGERAQNVKTRAALTARDEMLRERAAAIKPSDQIAAQRLEFQQNQAAKADKATAQKGFQEAIQRRRESTSPPLGLNSNVYAALAKSLLEEGYDDTDIDSWLYSADGQDKELEAALISGKQIPDPKTGKLRAPLDVLRERMKRSLDEQE